ncbi:MAG: response regulator [Chloroflexota bacterium]
MSFSPKTRRVLVVEDDPDIADLLAVVMEAEGLRALPAYDGEAAVEIAQEEQPDLITLDLALPKKDGRQVLHDLVADECTRDIPVIVVSAYSGKLRKEDLGHVACIVAKPFEVDDLLRKVREVLDGHDGDGKRR